MFERQVVILESILEHDLKMKILRKGYFPQTKMIVLVRRIIDLYYKDLFAYGIDYAKYEFDTAEDIMYYVQEMGGIERFDRDEIEAAI